MNLDVHASRASRPYTRREYLGRVLWAAAFPFFRLSPRVCFGWRRWLLRLFGASIGRDVHIYPRVEIVIPWNLTIGDQASIGDGALIYNLGPIEVGARTTISHRAHLCSGTHDHRDPVFPLMRLTITIGADAWVCADAFVGPGVEIADGAVVAAAAVVMRNVDAWTVVAGNPAKRVSCRQLRASQQDRGLRMTQSDART